ncbi:trichohyalin-like [Stylophora pistillata]|uniref:trichohyalin-like n=1 Tax=Stylophora pistillata TaxID=50429 RepID=UPI000C044938|nr:trichohyalin-like [Stylophora pistillata]
MASWLRSEKKGNQEHIPPPQLKSRIPIRVTRLCSDNFRSSSSKDKANKKVRLQRDSESKVQNKRFSRIPIVVYDKKTKVDSKENLTKNFKTTKGEKPLGRDSGIKLRDSQGKQDKKMASAIPLTRAKYGIYRRAKETTPKVRRRVPRQLPPTATESKKVCKDEKESREESSASEESSAAMAKEVTPDFECNATPVHEEELRMGAEENFSGSEFGDGFGRHSQSSDEKAMSNEPLWLREEYKEREEREDNINIMKGDATVTRSARNIRLQPVFDAENKVEENVLNEEKLDCSSFTESSGYKGKMAELGEKFRWLKAQFAEENREAIESMNKIEVEIKQSQAREDSVANEIEEMRRKQDEIKDDLELLDEMEKGREPEDKKWREKMDKKKIKVAHRLEKIRAEQRKYQEQTADENDSTDETDRPDQNSIESPESERFKHVTLENETVRNTDIGNKVLYEPHEIKEYEGVKELEKKRKELRQLKRLEKKAIKREKLEEKERKKIEKQMRKFASKLEKLSGKSSKALEETAEISKCINQPMEATNTAVKDKVDETPKVNEIKPHVDTTSDIAEPKQVQAAHSPGFNTNGTEVEQLGEMLTKVENKKHIALDSDASAKVELEEQSYSDAVKEKQKTYDCSDGQRKRIDDNNEIVIVSIGPLFRLPEVGEANLTLRDTDSILDESVDSEHSNRNYSNEEVPRQDKFDCFLDEVEGGIRTEESRSKSLQRAENEEDEKNFSECCALSRYQRSVAAVVNISEYLIQQELSKALETAIPDSRKDYTSRSEDSSSEEEPNLHKENEEMEFWKLKREKTDLEIQIFVANNELETYRKRIETVQADLDESKVKVKRLQSEGEYKERELENLKRDFQRKEQKWEEGNELLEEVMAERRALWDDVDYLEESLKNSQESNEGA